MRDAGPWAPAAGGGGRSWRASAAVGFRERQVAAAKTGGRAGGAPKQPVPCAADQVRPAGYFRWTTNLWTLSTLWLGNHVDDAAGNAHASRRAPVKLCNGGEAARPARHLPQTRPSAAGPGGRRIRSSHWPRAVIQ